jgi:hypothetical protein
MTEKTSKAIVILMSLILVAACSSDSKKPKQDDSAGGIWAGTRPTGTEVVVFVSESGAFRMLDPFGNVGHGQLDVSNTTEVILNYDISPPFMQTLFDGSSNASCHATGSVRERQVLSVETDCTSLLGTQFGGLLELSYSTQYDRESSFETLSGSYGENGDVVTIDSTGLLHGQIALTGCIFNGQVFLIDSEWNLYDTSLTTENCTGDYAPFNGVTWSGQASLVNTDGTDTLLGALTAGFGSQVVALGFVFPRI